MVAMFYVAGYFSNESGIADRSWVSTQRVRMWRDGALVIAVCFRFVLNSVFMQAMSYATCNKYTLYYSL
jgi:hypothetical protein